VGEDVDEMIYNLRRKPDVWKMFRPVDVTFYDLMYEPYVGRESYYDGTLAESPVISCVTVTFEQQSSQKWDK